LLAIAAAIIPRDEAVEVVHDALLAWWRQPERYDAMRGSILAWLAVIVRRKALDRRRSAMRRLAREHRTHEAASSDSVEEAVVERDATELLRLRHALAALPEEQRRVLWLSYFGCKTHVEIAGMLGLPLGTVKKRIALAMRRLRKEFAEEDDRASG